MEDEEEEDGRSEEYGLASDVVVVGVRGVEEVVLVTVVGVVDSTLVNGGGRR